MATTDIIKDISVKFAIAFEFEPNASNQKGFGKWRITQGLPWDAKDPASKKFAIDLDSAFNAKTKTYSHLSPGVSDTNSLAGKLKQFKDLESPENDDFTKAMNSFVTNCLKSEFDQSQLTTKFIVTVILYETFNRLNGDKQQHTAKEILNVSMIRSSEALQFDSNFRITKIPAIDFSNLLQSAKIEVDKFIENLQDDSEANHSEMSFIAGSGAIRDYFFRGLGAKDFVKNNLAGDNLLNGLDSFLLSLSLVKEDRNNIKDEIHSYLASPKRQQGVLLNDIQNHLDSHLPESAEDSKGTFITYLADHDFQVNETIVFSSAQRDRLIWIDVEISDVKMRFRLEDIGSKDSDAKLKYDSDNDTLSFEEKVTDPDTRKAIQKALK